MGVTAAIVRGRVVPGDVAVRDGRIEGVGLRPAGRRGIATPGFIDLQINGFSGVDFLDADVDAYRSVGPTLAATGVTAFQPTLISAPRRSYEQALPAARTAQTEMAAPRILGVHLEGPFLAPQWAGAHDPADLRNPDRSLVDWLLSHGVVTHVTLAPELPGGLDLIGHLAGLGVVVACGHSDADASVAHAAFDRGARAVTHLFNAHRRWSHRDPGLAGAALARRDVTVTIIADGIHLARENVAIAMQAARGRCALVTDATALACVDDSDSQLGTRKIRGDGSAARLADGTLAGSVLTMDQAIRTAVGAGVPMHEAIHAATTAPAELVGRKDLASIAPGTPADLTVLDDDLHVIRTLVAGREIHAS